MLWCAVPAAGRPRAPDVPHDRRRRVPGAAQSGGWSQARQQPVGAGEIGVHDHRVGSEQLAADADAPDPASVAIGEHHLVHRGPVADPPTCLDHRVGEAGRDGVHATGGRPHPGDDVHVADHGEHAERPLGGHAGVEGLEAEQPAQPIVAERPCDHAVQPAKRAEAQQLQRRSEGAGEVGHVVVVAIEERRYLHAAEAAEPVAVAVETLGLVGAADASNLGGHLASVGPYPQLGAVGEAGTVGGVQPGEGEVVVHLGARGRERRSQQVGHGQDRRTGVEAEAVPLEPAGPAAGLVEPLDDLDVPPGAGQVARGGQTAEAGADDDRPPRHRARAVTHAASA